MSEENDDMTKRGSSATTVQPSSFRSLLVAVDLTPGSDRVLARVARLPLPDDARITLLHVVPESLPRADQRHAARDARQALAEEARLLRQHLPTKLRIASLVKVGAPAKEIAAHAAEARSELIVMGRGGGRALRDTFLGSTAERVIRQVQLPVLVVRLPARAAYTRPALALDAVQPAQAIVRAMLSVLPEPRPRVEVIHAFDSPYHGMVYPSLSESDGAELKDDLRHQAGHELTKLLAEALADVPPASRPLLKAHVRHGSARTVVVSAIRKARSDLLVLGTHRYTGLAYVVLGTVAGDLLRAASCDVLVVPSARA